MTQHWRGRPEEESAMGRFMRHRWPPDSLYVLDIDRLICSKDLRRGILIEEKHDSASDFTCWVTRRLAERLGWWAALFIYSTADNSPRGEVTSINATFWTPQGQQHDIIAMDFDSFDDWIGQVIASQVIPSTSRDRDP